MNASYNFKNQSRLVTVMLCKTPCMQNIHYLMTLRDELVNDIRMPV